MTFNVGVIVGPILGGMLSDPAGSYPDLFGHIDFLKRFPYATPNLVAAFFLLCSFFIVWLWLEEVSLTEDYRPQRKANALMLARHWT
jgi:MFS family permease